MKVVLTIPYVSTNALYTINRHNGRRILSRKARDHKQAMTMEAKSQVGRKNPMAGEVKAEIYWFMPDHRKRDIDNLKMVIDAMTGVLWKDDSNIWELTIRKYVDKENPRIEIMVHK